MDEFDKIMAGPPAAPGGPTRHREGAPLIPEKEPISQRTTLRVLAFVIVVMPLLIPLNILLWKWALA